MKVEVFAWKGFMFNSLTHSPVKRRELPESVEICIVGGGIIGVCTALTLAERGVRVLLCEKGAIGGEQSSRNLGWIRQQGRDEAEFPLMVESNRLWRDMEKRCQSKTLHFNQNGIAYLSNDAADAETYEKHIEMARQYGVYSKIISADEIEKYMEVGTNKWKLALLTPSDGRVEPASAPQSVAKAAIAKGAIIAENCAVRGLDVTAGTVRSVITEKGQVKTEQVVLAGGAWTSLFLNRIGITIPQLLIQSSVAKVDCDGADLSCNASDGEIAFFPCVDGGVGVSLCDQFLHPVGYDSFRHMRRYARVLRQCLPVTRLKLAGMYGSPGDWRTLRHWSEDMVSPFEKMRILNPTPDSKSVSKMMDRIKARFSSLRSITLVNSWAGSIDVLPDFVPIIDKAKEIDSLWIATGFSGHGFALGPVVGRILADGLKGRASGYDMHRFRLDRFADGSRLHPGPTF